MRFVWQKATNPLSPPSPVSTILCIYLSTCANEAEEADGHRNRGDSCDKPPGLLHLLAMMHLRAVTHLCQCGDLQAAHLCSCKARQRLIRACSKHLRC